jgi:hypothetical protein
MASPLSNGHPNPALISLKNKLHEWFTDGSSRSDDDEEIPIEYRRPPNNRYLDAIDRIPARDEEDSQRLQDIKRPPKQNIKDTIIAMRVIGSKQIAIEQLNHQEENTLANLICSALKAKPDDLCDSKGYEYDEDRYGNIVIEEIQSDSNVLDTLVSGQSHADDNIYNYVIMHTVEKDDGIPKAYIVVHRILFDEDGNESDVSKHGNICRYFSEKYENSSPKRSLSGTLLIRKVADSAAGGYKFAIGAYSGRWAIAKDDFIGQNSEEAEFDFGKDFKLDSLSNYLDALNTAILTRLLQSHKFECFNAECIVPDLVDDKLYGGASAAVAWGSVLLGVLVTAAASIAGALVRA